MGLRLRLSLVIMIPLVLVLGVYGAWRLHYEQQELLAENQRLIGLTAKAVQISVENALRGRQMSEIQHFLAALVEGQEQIDRIRLFNHALQPTLVSNPLAIPEHVPDVALRKVLATGRADWFYAQRGLQSILYYVVPLRGGDGRTEGAIEIVQLASGVEDRVRAALWDVVFRLTTLLISVGLLTGFVLQRQVLQPVARLMEGIRRVGEGEAGSRLAVDRSDELGRVAAAFNTMATQLETARARLVEESERALELGRRVRHAQTVAVAGRLATALAHEIGTPLNIISGRAETVLRELPANDRRREELTVIVEQIDRIVGMIRALLDTVRPAKPEIRSVDIGGVVHGLLPLLRHAARVKGQTLVAEIPPALPTVLADANQLQQIIINLVVNAVEAAPNGGEVRIDVATGADGDRAGVRVTVHDTGPGIPPELRGRVFQPFFTTKPPGRGTGLGLTICRDIVKEHAGAIRIDDTEDGGATVAIWLPVAETAA